MDSKYEVVVKRLFCRELDLDKNVYRRKVRNGEKYNWKVIYKYSDLLISSDKDISDKIEKPVKEIYKLLEFCIKKDPIFFKSLSPVRIKSYFPEIIKKMCEKSAIFNVGPMATVAGAVSEYLADNLNKYCSQLIIENGGDVYIRSKKDVNVGVYLKNKYFEDKINLKIKKGNTPCGLCSSSGSFGHSLSLGKSDLVVVLAESTVSADGAATAVANNIISPDDISQTINHYKKVNEVEGILIVKDSKIGLWGNLELII